MIKNLCKSIFIVLLVISVLCFNIALSTVYADDNEYTVTVEENKFVNVTLSRAKGKIGETVEITVTALDDVNINEVFAVTTNGTTLLDRLVLDEELELYGPYIYHIEGFDAKIVVAVSAKSNDVVQSTTNTNTDVVQIDSNEDSNIWLYVVIGVGVVAVAVGAVFVVKAIKRKKQQW